MIEALLCSLKAPLHLIAQSLKVSGLYQCMHAGEQRAESCCLAPYLLSHLLEVCWRWY